MFSGTVFVRQREPDPNLKLPRSCWAVYDRLDGEKSIGQVAEALGLSEAETFAVVRQLQQQDLIEEPMLSYPAYQERETGEGRQTSTEATERSVPEVSGDGARSGSANGTPSAAAVDGPTDGEAEAIHLPTLWDWLEEATDNVKSYKNTQAFVLMEASDALESIGVSNMEDLEDMEQCSDPSVVEALETAIQNNVDEHIPEQCYR
jgi:transposase-like protein